VERDFSELGNERAGRTVLPRAYVADNRDLDTDDCTRSLSEPIPVLRAELLQVTGTSRPTAACSTRAAHQSSSPVPTASSTTRRRAGTVGIRALTETGELAFTELTRARAHATKARTGIPLCTTTSYSTTDGAGSITVRLHNTQEDSARRLNRTENVGPIPPSDPDFQRRCSRRNDAASSNRNLDDTLWLGRAHSVGHPRQTLSTCSATP